MYFWMVECCKLLMKKEIIANHASRESLTQQPTGPMMKIRAPMRIGYIECFSGISGDMFLGALIDAGVSAKLLENTVAELNIGASLKISRVVRSGISATKVDVWAGGEKDKPR